MSKRFFNPLSNFVSLLLAIGTVVLVANIGFPSVTHADPPAAEVTLAWDAITTTPEGYYLFQRTEDEGYNYDQPCWTGADTTGTVSDLEWDTTYYFVARAYDGDDVSTDSNEVSYHTSAAYTITATAGDNGSISPSGSVTIEEGTDQAFSVTADEGYEIEDLIVDDVSQGALETYTFTDVTDDHTITATFAVKTYSISATSGANGSVSPVGTATVEYGGSATYTITPDSGYSISDVVVDGVSQGAIESYTFSNIADDHSIEATFEYNGVVGFTVSASAGAGGSISPSGEIDVNSGDSQTFTITPDSGYSISNVVVDGVSQGPISTYTFTNVTADHTITATFTSTSHTISATSGANGSISPSGTTTVDHGGSVTYTITPDSGYSISDVRVDGTSQGTISTYTFSNVTYDHTITATFTSTSHTITATSGANGSVSPAGTTTVDHGGSITYTITPDSGYSISDVQVDGTSQGTISTYTFTNVTADHTITATFTSTSHTISATSGANGSISPPGTTTVDHGGSVTYTITPDSGYSISDVQVDGTSQGTISTYTFSNVTYDHTITATFTSTSHTITATSGANGSVSPGGTTTVDHGGSVTYTITPDSGYSISDVQVDGTSQGTISTYTFSNVTYDHTITATFASTSHTITATSGANGSVSPAGTTTVDHGGSVTYTITPDSGYSISDVQVDGVSQGAIATYTFSNVAADHSLQATFIADTVMVSASAGEGGSISPSGEITVNSGSSQTFTITADEGYEIEDVLVDDVSQGAAGSYTLENILADCTVQALFTLENEAPVADAGPDQTVAEGQSVTLNGLNSTDADDGIAKFQWYQILGTEVELDGADQGQAGFAAPDVDESGESLVFELHVTDYSGQTTTDTCIVNVTWINEPPTADAGQAQTVDEGTVVTLDGSGSSDADDGISQYYWAQTQGPAVVLSDDAAAVATFTAPDIDSDGASLAFQLTVTDFGGLQDTASCLVAVSWVNSPPLADAGDDQQVEVGDNVTLDGTQSTDPDGDTGLSYRWRQTEGPPVELSDATADQPSFEAPEIEDETDTLEFELTVTDSEGLQDLDACRVVVAASDEDTTAPTLTVFSPARDWVITTRSTIKMSGRASDDTAVKQVSWKNSRGGSGVANGTTKWKIKRMRLKKGLNIITLTATDTAGNETSVTKYVFVLKWWWW